MGTYNAIERASKCVDLDPAGMCKQKVRERGLVLVA